MGAEKILISHTSNVRDEISLQKIEEKDKQFFIEKIIAKIENKNPYEKNRKRTRNYARN